MANKKLGQCFLINKERVRQIIEALGLGSKDVVVEIGPGNGELTHDLALRISEANGQLIAIEKDKELADRLASNLRIPSATQRTELQIITGDALQILPIIATRLRLEHRPYKVIGNIPYYITGKLFRILGELEYKPELTILTTQKEVAERVAAKPPKMNLLAASVQIWAWVEIVGLISKGDFRPQPKVDSAIVKLITRNYDPLGQENDDDYYKFIKTLFKQPRKTILNNIIFGLEANADGKKQFSKDEVVRRLKLSGINPEDRPQELDVELIRKLSREI